MFSLETLILSVAQQYILTMNFPLLARFHQPTEDPEWSRAINASFIFDEQMFLHCLSNVPEKDIDYRTFPRIWSFVSKRNQHFV